MYLGILSFAVYLRDNAIESLKMANRPSYVIYWSGVVVYVHILYVSKREGRVTRKKERQRERERERERERAR